jgi:hypothetical protein
MPTTVFSISPFRDVHDIDVTTQKGRRFTIDIYKNNSGFDTEVTVLDRVSSNPGSWLYKTNPASSSALDNFDAAVQLIQDYLAQVDAQDSVKDIDNPCNTPFISDVDQNAVLAQKGLSLNVKVN